MKARILRTTVALCLLPAVASAQDGLRSAVLSEPPLAALSSPSRVDFFRAEPDPRAQRKNRRDAPGPFDHLLTSWYLGQVLPYAYPWQVTPPADSRQAETGETRPRRQDRIALLLASRAPIERPPAAAPGAPKTFYVIAGCYAGDTPPRPERLPPTCDASKVRVIQP